jgi:hypothetical protein
MMNITRISLGVTALAAASLLAAVAHAQLGRDKVAFPADYAKGVLYSTLDRPDLKQFRELYASAAAVEAAKAGKPLPDGTVLTMVQYAALLTAAGEPQKDASGRFIKGPIVGYTVMEKRPGWGAEYRDELRNGEWEYNAFTADRKANPRANVTACFSCHKPLGEKVDFTFSYDRMKEKK